MWNHHQTVLGPGVIDPDQPPPEPIHPLKERDESIAQEIRDRYERNRKHYKPIAKHESQQYRLKKKLIAENALKRTLEQPYDYWLLIPGVRSVFQGNPVVDGSRRQQRINKETNEKISAKKRDEEAEYEAFVHFGTLPRGGRFAYEDLEDYDKYMRDKKLSRIKAASHPDDPHMISPHKSLRANLQALALQQDMIYSKSYLQENFDHLYQHDTATDVYPSDPIERDKVVHKYEHLPNPFHRMIVDPEVRRRNNMDFHEKPILLPEDQVVPSYVPASVAFAAGANKTRNRYINDILKKIVEKKELKKIEKGMVTPTVRLMPQHPSKDGKAPFISHPSRLSPQSLDILDRIHQIGGTSVQPDDIDITATIINDGDLDDDDDDDGPDYLQLALDHQKKQLERRESQQQLYDEINRIKIGHRHRILKTGSNVAPSGDLYALQQRSGGVGQIFYPPLDLHIPETFPKLSSLTKGSDQHIDVRPHKPEYEDSPDAERLNDRSGELKPEDLISHRVPPRKNLSVVKNILNRQQIDHAYLLQNAPQVRYTQTGEAYFGPSKTQWFFKNPYDVAKPDQGRFPSTPSSEDIQLEYDLPRYITGDNTPKDINNLHTDERFSAAGKEKIEHVKLLLENIDKPSVLPSSLANMKQGVSDDDDDDEEDEYLRYLDPDERFDRRLIKMDIDDDCKLPPDERKILEEATILYELKSKDLPVRFDSIHRTKKYFPYVSANPNVRHKRIVDTIYAEHLRKESPDMADLLDEYDFIPSNPLDEQEFLEAEVKRIMALRKEYRDRIRQKKEKEIFDTLYDDDFQRSPILTQAWEQIKELSARAGIDLPQTPQSNAVWDTPGEAPISPVRIDPAQIVIHVNPKTNQPYFQPPPVADKYRDDKFVDDDIDDDDDDDDFLSLPEDDFEDLWRRRHKLEQKKLRRAQQRRKPSDASYTDTDFYNLIWEPRLRQDIPSAKYHPYFVQKAEDKQREAEELSHRETIFDKARKMEEGPVRKASNPLATEMDFPTEHERLEKLEYQYQFADIYFNSQMRPFWFKTEEELKDHFTTKLKDEVEVSEKEVMLNRLQRIEMFKKIWWPLSIADQYPENYEDIEELHVDVSDDPLAEELGSHWGQIAHHILFYQQWIQDKQMQLIKTIVPGKYVDVEQPISASTYMKPFDRDDSTVSMYPRHYFNAHSYVRKSLEIEFPEFSQALQRTLGTVTNFHTEEDIKEAAAVAADAQLNIFLRTKNRYLRKIDRQIRYLDLQLKEFVFNPQRFIVSWVMDRRQQKIDERLEKSRKKALLKRIDEAEYDVYGDNTYFWPPNDLTPPLDTPPTPSSFTSHWLQRFYQDEVVSNIPSNMMDADDGEEHTSEDDNDNDDDDEDFDIDLTKPFHFPDLNFDYHLYKATGELSSTFFNDDDDDDDDEDDEESIVQKGLRDMNYKYSTYPPDQIHIAPMFMGREYTRRYLGWLEIINGRDPYEGSLPYRLFGWTGIPQRIGRFIYQRGWDYRYAELLEQDKATLRRLGLGEDFGWDEDLYEKPPPGRFESFINKIKGKKDDEDDDDDDDDSDDDDDVRGDADDYADDHDTPRRGIFNLPISRGVPFQTYGDYISAMSDQFGFVSYATPGGYGTDASPRLQRLFFYNAYYAPKLLTGAFVAITAASKSGTILSPTVIDRHFTLHHQHARQRPWTLLTSALTHLGWPHLIFNSMAMNSFSTSIGGTTNEYFFRMFTILALGSSLLSLSMSKALYAALRQPTLLAPAVGASGAITGMVSLSALAQGKENEKRIGIMFLPIQLPMYTAWKYLILADVLGLCANCAGFSTKISHTGHLGGYLMGYLVHKYYEFKYNRYFKPKTYTAFKNWIEITRDISDKKVRQANRYSGYTPGVDHEGSYDEYGDHSEDIQDALDDYLD